MQDAQHKQRQCNDTSEHLNHTHTSLMLFYTHKTKILEQKCHQNEQKYPPNSSGQKNILSQLNKMYYDCCD